MLWRARCRETGTAGSASGLEKRTGSNPGTALQAGSTMRPPVHQLCVVIPRYQTACDRDALPPEYDRRFGSVV